VAARGLELAPAFDGSIEMPVRLVAVRRHPKYSIPVGRAWTTMPSSRSCLRRSWESRYRSCAKARSIERLGEEGTRLSRRHPFPPAWAVACKGGGPALYRE
jgi:hypothetical protein